MKYQVDENRFFEVLKNGEHRCGYCGIDLDAKSIVADFKIPRSLGGEDTLDNLLAVCKDCAKLKGQQTVEEFRANIFESISLFLDRAYDAYEKVSGLMDDDTAVDVMTALVSTKMVMKRKIITNAVTFHFEKEKEVIATPLVPDNAEVRQ